LGPPKDPATFPGLNFRADQRSREQQKAKPT
jgi:hypothetical protein